MTGRAFVRLGVAVAAVAVLLPAPARAYEEPSPGAPRDDGLIVASKLLSDARSVPGLFGAAIGIGLGFPLTAFGYPELTQPLAASVLPPLATAAGQAASGFGPVVDAAEPAVAGFGPPLNPVLRPPLQTGAAALGENAPGLGSKTTSRHFGLHAPEKAGEIPPAPLDEALNFSTRVRALPVRFLFRMPLEVEAGLPESRVETTNGYGAVFGAMNPGLLPSAVLWSDVGFFGGTLAPRPGHAEAHFPTGPLTSSSPVIRPLQADGARWGDFSARVDQHGQGEGMARAGRVEIPRLLSVANIEGSATVENLGNRVLGTAVSRVSDVTLLDGAVTVNSIKLVITASGSGSAEGGERTYVPELQGVKVGGVPVVVLADGVRVAGAELISAAARQAAEQAVADTLRSAGIALAAVPMETGDSSSEGGSTTQATGAVLRVRFNRPDRPQLYQIDLGYASSVVFTGRSGTLEEGASAPDAGALPATPASHPATANPAGSSTQARGVIAETGATPGVPAWPEPPVTLPGSAGGVSGHARERSAHPAGARVAPAPPLRAEPAAVGTVHRAVTSFYQGLMVLVLFGLVALPLVPAILVLQGRLSP